LKHVNRLVAILTAIAAPVAILLWGYAYLREVYEALLAPGVPIEYRLKTPGGEVAITAESYRIDTSGPIHVERVAVRTPEGRLLAQARTVDLDGLKLAQSGGKAIDVRVRDLSGELRREADGKLELLRYIPEQKGPPEENPFKVQVSGIDLKLVDLAGKKPFRRTLQSALLWVDGVGEDWVAGGNVTLGELGRLPLYVQHQRGRGVLVRTTASSAELGPIIAHLKTTPEGKSLDGLQPLSARSLVASGPVRFLIPTSGYANFEGDVRAAAKDLNYQDIDASSATFAGYLNLEGARGVFAARRNDGRFDLVGSMDWRKGFMLAGNSSIRSAKASDIPESLRKTLPKNFEYQAIDYRGWIAYSEKMGAQLQGLANAGMVSYEQEVALDVSGPIAYSDRLLRADLKGRYQGLDARTSLAYLPKKNSVTGWAVGQRVPLSTLARYLPAASRPTKVAGAATVTATFFGPLNALQTDVVAQAQGSFALRDLPTVVVRRFGLSADYSNGKLLVRRLAAETNFGKVAGYASINPETGKLTGQVLAADVGLAVFDRSLSGRGIARGQISGTLQKPRLAGQMLVLGLQAMDQSVPVAKADFSVDPSKLVLTKLSAVQESGRLDGLLALTFASGKLSGSGKVEGVPLDAYLSDTQGLIDFTSVRVGGTLKKPTLAFRAEGDEILLGDEVVETVRAQGRLEGQTMRLTAAKLGFAGGQIEADGDYNLTRKRGVFNVTGQGVVLPKVNALAKLPIPITGTAQLKLVARGSGSVWALDGSGRVDKVTIDGTSFGDGLWTVGGNTKRLTASAQLGSLERYLQLDEVVYEPEKRSGSANLLAYKNQLQDYYLAARKSLNLDFETQSALDTMQGTLDADIGVKFEGGKLSLSANTFAATGLTVRERLLGDLSLSAIYDGSLVGVNALDFKGPAGTLSVKGSYDADGSVSAEGNLDAFDLTTLGLFRREWSRLNGKADLAFVASGIAKNPTVQASLFATQDLLQAGTDDKGAAIETKVPLYLELAPITITPFTEGGGGLSLEGKVRYRTFEGKLLGTIPYDLATGIDEKRQVDLRMDVDAELLRVEGSAGFLDPARTTGVAKGMLRFTGPAGDAKLIGDLTVADAKIGINGLKTAFDKLDANIHFEGGALRATAKANGSNEGTLAADISWQLPEIDDLIRSLVAGDTVSMLSTPLSGTLSAQAFTFNEESKAYGSGRGQIDGDITVAGTPMRPILTGPITLARIDLKLPEVAIEAGPSGPPPIDPIFNIPITIRGTARASTSMMNLGMTGAGLLQGSLTEPDFSANLRIQGGELKLPTAKIAVEPGGAVRPSYRGSFAQTPEFRLDVDLEGRTRVTAARYGDNVERYDVSLRIRGDLLKEGALTFTASSDPPDLSQDRILALLGKADLIEGLAGGLGRSTDSQLRQAIATFALPVFLEPITRQLASGLGLESISLDYDPGDIISVSFAKILGRGLILTGSRQVNEPLPGIRQKYEIKLSYRIPVQRRGFDRYRLILGSDQLTPLKLGVEYSTRFGNLPPSQTSKRRILSGPKDDQSRKVN